MKMSWLCAFLLVPLALTAYADGLVDWDVGFVSRRAADAAFENYFRKDGGVKAAYDASLQCHTRAVQDGFSADANFCIAFDFATMLWMKKDNLPVKQGDYFEGHTFMNRTALYFALWDAGSTEQITTEIFNATGYRQEEQAAQHAGK